ncbi:hypothetical protein A9977_29040 [Variovorax sp. UMC13]|nr:hypothetical protein [Variovorax sp. UMC13]
MPRSLSSRSLMPRSASTSRRSMAAARRRATQRRSPASRSDERQAAVGRVIGGLQGGVSRDLLPHSAIVEVEISEAIDQLS